ncbi:hypothetical protein ACFPZL_03990 [Leucobacter soli]|uniref:DUF4232 domain-containing protein n=1 Tax=Leucobacter soli TaxID=2812850 RepID=A0A916JW18_9MICO|nr:hypothetical protein [Leucobacter soli]CAG7604688.1 hypothetical protein LEUCIP111803_00753 [Leucobacter soli]
MSGWRDPLGPKPKSVYVRRRILALAVLVAIVVAVALIIWKPGSSGGANAGSKVEIPDGVSETQAPADEDGEDGDASEDVAECKAKRLEVVPVTDRESYAADEEPEFSLTVANTGKKPCTADLGTAGMVFEVTSGSDRVWVSTDCQTQPDHRAVVLEPGQKLSTEAIVWDRTRSSAGTCDIARDPVGADGASYHLRVTAAGVDSTGTAQFLLY